jgi:type II secretory ATPase GspE/PulE/Tfp pilus assembly ATPase PilB-like protein
MDEELRGAVQHNASAGHLATLGLERGMRLLKEDGLRLITTGVTTPAEVLRVANV